MKRGTVRVKGDEVRVKEECSESSKHGAALAAALSAPCYPRPCMCALVAHFNALPESSPM